MHAERAQLLAQIQLGASRQLQEFALRAVQQEADRGQRSVTVAEVEPARNQSLGRDCPASGCTLTTSRNAFPVPDTEEVTGSIPVSPTMFVQVGGACPTWERAVSHQSRR